MKNEQLIINLEDLIAIKQSIVSLKPHHEDHQSPACFKQTVEQKKDALKRINKVLKTYKPDVCR